MMVIPSSGKERGLAPESLSDGEAEDVAVKLNRPVQIRDFQMDVADACLRVDGQVIHEDFISSKSSSGKPCHAVRVFRCVVRREVWKHSRLVELGLQIGRFLRGAGRGNTALGDARVLISKGNGSFGDTPGRRGGVRRIRVDF